jgi:hypothetical protein
MCASLIGFCPDNSLTGLRVQIASSNSLFRCRLLGLTFAEILEVAMKWTQLIAAILSVFALSAARGAEPRFDYHDDRDGRNLADVRLTVKHRSELPTLEILISAVGPNVDPIPGYRGVKGANRYTAEELELMLSGQHDVLVATSRSALSGLTRGSIHGGRRGRIPQRRLLSTGRIDFLAKTSLEYPLEVKLNTGPISRGTQETEILIDGIPRMRISFHFDGRRAQITGFESVGDPEHTDASHHQLRPLPSDVSPFAAQNQAGKPKKPARIALKPPVTAAAWKRLDNEGKWVRFQASIEAPAGPGTGDGWVVFLVEQKDYEFLEWVGLYHIDAMKQLGVGPALAKANAPQWLRAVAWSRSTPQSLGHGEAQSRSLLRSHNPEFAFSWLEKHKKIVVTERSPAKLDYDFLKKKKYKLLDVSSALPPLKAENVFTHLDAPATLADFGNRKKAEAGKVYQHQVLRAIDGFVASGRYFEPWLGKVMSLTRHSDQKVRQAALLSITHFYSKLDAKKYPISELVKVADDPGEPDAIRESAFMAYTYFGHPSVWPKLHVVAVTPTHPGWRAAISRLANYGNGFTIQYLSDLDESSLTPDDAKLWATTRKNLAAIEDLQQNQGQFLYNSGGPQRVALERVAVAELTNSPVAEQLTAWTVREIASGMNRKGLADLKKLRDTYELTIENKVGTGTVKEWVRGLARKILATARE